MKIGKNTLREKSLDIREYKCLLNNGNIIEYHIKRKEINISEISDYSPMKGTIFIEYYRKLIVNYDENILTYIRESNSFSSCVFPKVTLSYNGEIIISDFENNLYEEII